MFYRFMGTCKNCFFNFLSIGETGFSIENANLEFASKEIFLEDF